MPQVLLSTAEVFIRPLGIPESTLLAQQYPAEQDVVVTIACEADESMIVRLHDYSIAVVDAGNREILNTVHFRIHTINGGEHLERTEHEMPYFWRVTAEQPLELVGRVDSQPLFALPTGLSGKSLNVQLILETGVGYLGGDSLHSPSFSITFPSLPAYQALLPKPWPDEAEVKLDDPEWFVVDGIIVNTLAYEVFEDMDSASFEVLSDTFSRDVKRLYLGRQPLRRRDHASFHMLNRVYACDKNGVYDHYGKPVKNADLATFEVLDNGNPGYARDATTLWWNVGNTLGNAAKVTGCKQPCNFEVMAKNYPFGRDEKAVYFERSRIKGAKLKSWEYLFGPYSRDTDSIFFEGDKIVDQTNDYQSADISTWQHLGGDYSRDAKCLYERCWRVEGVNSNDIEVLYAPEFTYHGGLHRIDTILTDGHDIWEGGYYEPNRPSTLLRLRKSMQALALNTEVVEAKLQKAAIDFVDA